MKLHTGVWTHQRVAPSLEQGVLQAEASIKVCLTAAGVVQIQLVKVKPSLEIGVSAAEIVSVNLEQRHPFDGCRHLDRLRRPACLFLLYLPSPPSPPSPVTLLYQVACGKWGALAASNSPPIRGEHTAGLPALPPPPSPATVRQVESILRV